MALGSILDPYRMIDVLDADLVDRELAGVRAVLNVLDGNDAGLGCNGGFHRGHSLRGFRRRSTPLAGYGAGTGYPVGQMGVFMSRTRPAAMAADVPRSVAPRPRGWRDRAPPGRGRRRASRARA